jgi:hypothetical protein
MNKYVVGYLDGFKSLQSGLPYLGHLFRLTGRNQLANFTAKSFTFGTLNWRTLTDFGVIISPISRQSFGLLETFNLCSHFIFIFLRFRLLPFMKSLLQDALPIELRPNEVGHCWQFHHSPSVAFPY